MPSQRRPDPTRYATGEAPDLADFVRRRKDGRLGTVVRLRAYCPRSKGKPGPDPSCLGVAWEFPAGSRDGRRLATSNRPVALDLVER